MMKVEAVKNVHHSPDIFIFILAIVSQGHTPRSIDR